MKLIKNLHWVTSILVMFIFMGQSSCKKDDKSNPTDPKYPTTLERLNQTDLQSRLNDLWARNPYLQSDLNAFGFCASSTNYRQLEPPPTYKMINFSEAKSIAKKFILLNPRETGVTDTSSLIFTLVRQFTTGGTYVTYVQSQEQTLDSIKLQYTGLSFRIENNEVVECINNWFPEVYTPSEYFISADQAISNLKGKEYTLPTMSGSVTGTVTESDLAGATVRTMMMQYPHPTSTSTSNTLELRIAYKIHLPAIWTIFYTDVMDGKVLGSAATIISK
jgi:hypothetical protein